MLKEVANSITKVLDKLHVGIIFGMLFFTSGMILFGKTWLGIEPILTVPYWNTWILLVFLISFSYFVIQTSIKISQLYQSHSIRSLIKIRIRSLSSTERLLLQYCLARSQQSFPLPITDGAAHSLVQKGILHKASGEGGITNWPYMIPDWLWSYLQKNPWEIFGEEDHKNPDVVKRINDAWRRYTNPYM